MRVVKFFLLCALILLFTALAFADNNESRDFRLDFYEEYCNCDENCGEFSSCLTDETDLFIKNIDTRTDDKIAEAEEAGYRGICTAVTLDGELMIYSMTSDCTAEEEEPEAGSDEEPGEEGDVISSNRIITISFDDGENSSPNPAQTNNSKISTGGYNMDLITAVVISGTIVLVGFFGLMAWIAYLLQQKSVGGKK